MVKKERNSNIELLRIICMYFVIAGHVIMKYKNDSLGTNEYFISNILRSFFVVAVNCFVIISGYFSINLNYKKLIKMSFQVSFYVITIYLLTLVFSIHTINIKADILLLFPIITKRYWYITVYFALCLVSPLLNIIVENINKAQFQRMLFGAFILFYLIPTGCYIINAPTITGDAGYGIINFICLYFVGRYLRLHFNQNKSKIFYTVVFIVSSFSIFVGNYILTLILGFEFSSFISYDTIFNFVSAIMLFKLFESIDVKSNIINRLAEYALVAFIIHMHPTLYDYLFNSIFKIQEYSGISYLLSIFIIPIIIYLFSWGIEFVRVTLLDKVENNIITLILGKFKKKEKTEIGLA